MVEANRCVGRDIDADLWICSRHCLRDSHAAAAKKGEHEGWRMTNARRESRCAAM